MIAVHYFTVNYLRRSAPWRWPTFRPTYRRATIQMQTNY